jgi:hypothetical protein
MPAINNKADIRLVRLLPCDGAAACRSMTSERVGVNRWQWRAVLPGCVYSFDNRKSRAGRDMAERVKMGGLGEIEGWPVRNNWKVTVS